MEENNKSSEDPEFSFQVSPEFYQNFSTFPIIESQRIQNNILLPSYIKLAKIRELESLYISKKGSVIKEDNSENFKKQTISSFLSQKFPTEKLWNNLNDNLIEIDPEKTKSMVISDLSQPYQNIYLFLLNPEWIEKKRIEKEEKEKEKLKELFEKELKLLKTPVYRNIIKEIRSFDWGLIKLERKEGINVKEWLIKKIKKNAENIT